MPLFALFAIKQFKALPSQIWYDMKYRTNRDSRKGRRALLVGAAGREKWKQREEKEEEKQASHCFCLENK